MKIKHTRITKYIEKRLLRKIKEEILDHYLTNERDIESAIYHHLRDKIIKDETLRIATNYTVSKLRVPGSKRAAKGKRSFRQPDIVVLRTADRPRPLIAIELKRKLRSNNVVDLITKDVRKLELFKKKKIIHKGYILFITNNYALTAAQIEDEANKSVKVNGVKVLVINPIEDLTDDEREEYFQNLKKYEKYNFKTERRYKRIRSKAAKKQKRTLGRKGVRRAAKKAAKTKKENRKRNEAKNRKRVKTRKRRKKMRRF